MVIMASPSRHLDVASRAKAPPWHPIGRGGHRKAGKAAVRTGKKGGGERAREIEHVYLPCERAGHPCSTQIESGREREERGEEKRAAAAPRIRQRTASIQPPLLLPRHQFEAPAAPRPPTSTLPIRPSNRTSAPPIRPSDWTSAC
jgi:hypothetical protein